MNPRSDNLILKQILEYLAKSTGEKTPQEIALALGIKERKVRKLLEKQKLPKKPPQTRRGIPQPIKIGVMLFSMFLIFLSGILVYANSINNKFVWDDEIQIQDNNEIRSWSNLPRIFVENVGTGSGRKYNFYRPLETLTLMINYSLTKYEVESYHWINILLHILTALCIYALTNLLFRHNILSLFTALLYVVHPIHTEVVTYISGRADSLSAFFMLLCFIIYVKTTRAGFLNILLISLGYILAILSKENALILPALILLYHYIFRGFDLKKFLPLIVITLIYIVLRMTVLYFPSSEDQTPNTLFERMPGFFIAVTNYLSLLVLPFDLHMEYGDMLFKLSDPKAFIGILLISLAAFCAFWFRTKDKLVTFSILWFFICLFPESNLYRINAYMNEHWLYLPSLGFFLILARSLTLLYEKGRLKVIAIIACSGLLLFFSILTVKQNTYWKDAISFYQRSIKYSPFSSRLYNNLARQYSLSGRTQEAVELYKKAIALSPNYAEAYNNLGVAFADLGQNSEAIEAYKTAIKLDPDMVGAYSNLGNAFGKSGKNPEAIDTFQKALKIRPDSSTYNNLAMVYKALGENDKTIDALKKADELDSSNPTILFNLGNAYAFSGKSQEAINIYKQVIALAPDNANAYNNIGYLLMKEKQYDEAIGFFDTALKLNSHMPEVYENLGLTYHKLGNDQLVREVCNKAISADPANAQRYKNLLDTIKDQGPDPGIKK